ncbi:MAG: exo-alpha-sialidase [Clostridia bacterium]|nr:exo-alpha-sialidase [Clostridia bacterium]
MQKFTVSRDNSIYEAWPDVVLTDAGTLVCVFSECEHHNNRDKARLALVTSTDRGRSWSAKRYLTEPGRRDAYYNCARISKLSDGRLALVCDYITSTSENEKGKSVVHLWLSEDNGESWTGPIATPARGIVPDRLLELKGGRWLLAAHHPDPETKKLTEYVWYSDDQGGSWSEQITMASAPRYNLCEASMVEVEPGVIAAFLRENSGQGWDCFKAISRDGGESWEGVYNVPLPGCHRPTAGILRDGRMLITYRFMQGGKGWLGSWTQNVFGALMPSESALITQRGGQSARIFPIDFDRSLVSDLGYTGWVQFDDGEIYVVNYIVDDAPKAQIRGYSFRAEEFLLE